jgi:hypothetical protein
MEKPARSQPRAIALGMATVGVALGLGAWLLREPTAAWWLRLLDGAVALGIGGLWGAVMQRHFAARAPREGKRP